MPVSDSIKKIAIKEEFRVCQVCGHDAGFSVSLQQSTDQPAHIILICPECGQRYEVGWEVELTSP